MICCRCMIYATLRHVYDVLRSESLDDTKDGDKRRAVAQNSSRKETRVKRLDPGIEKLCGSMI